MADAVSAAAEALPQALEVCSACKGFLAPSPAHARAWVGPPAARARRCGGGGTWSAPACGGPHARSPSTQALYRHQDPGVREQANRHARAGKAPRFRARHRVLLSTDAHLPLPPPGGSSTSSSSRRPGRRAARTPYAGGAPRSGAGRPRSRCAFLPRSPTHSCTPPPHRWRCSCSARRRCAPRLSATLRSCPQARTGAFTPRGPPSRSHTSRRRNLAARQPDRRAAALQRRPQRRSHRAVPFSGGACGAYPSRRVGPPRRRLRRAHSAHRRRGARKSAALSAAAAGGAPSGGWLLPTSHQA